MVDSDAPRIGHPRVSTIEPNAIDAQNFVAQGLSSGYALPMTGLESAGAAAVGIAANAVKGGVDAARQQRAEEHRALLEVAKQSPGFQQAARIKGNKMAVKEALGLIIMKPLAGIMGLSREYFDTQFAEDYAEKIANIPEENLQTPKAYIAGPAFEGLAYSLDEPKLKEMYLELLARASDDRLANHAHPSFVQIIRELTTAEAVYLSEFLREVNLSHPIVEYRAKYKPSEGWRAELSNVLDLRTDEGETLYDPMVPTYVDNWVRLKLVSVDYESSLTRDDAYVWESTRPEREKVQAAIDERLERPSFQASMAENGIEGVVVDAQRGVMTTTSFGAQFARVVGMTEGGS